MSSKVFGEKLRALRLADHCTQEEMSRYLCISRSTYTYYETGKSEPDMQKLLLIGRRYGVALEELIDEAYSAECIAKRYQNRQCVAKRGRIG